MKIKILESMYNHIRYLSSKVEPKLEGSKTLTCYGPYGSYEIVSVPDEEYTEVILKEVRHYKENK